MSSTEPNPAAPSVSWRVCAVVGAAVAAAVLAAAWISDDALVTFRTVENLVDGHGLRWNPADRTQVATHPLWVLVLGAARACTGELYFTAIAVCTALSALGALLLARASASRAAALAIALLGMLASRSFVVFGTCGLENALVYALLGAFALVWLRGEPGERQLRASALLGGLLALARQDLVLLVAPCIVAAAWTVARAHGWRRAVRALLPGAAAPLAWYAFAWIYYGTVIPTPGYGKVVSLDLPLGELAQQGAWYLVDLVRHDPASALTLAAALVVGVTWRRARFMAPALGVLLQLLYVLRVGGDFMSGRFCTAAFVLALALAAQVRGRARVALGAAFALAMFAGGLPVWTAGTPRQSDARIEHGIGDERAYYAELLGLWSPRRMVPQYAMFGRAFADHARPPVLLAHAAGVPGYLNGPYAHIVDPFLCDPLLMRLPLADRREWRVGHWKRRLPEGWLETLASGDNRLRNRDLAAYWDALAVLLRAPVWSRERWRVWWGFQIGDYEPLLARYVAADYRTPPCIAVAVDELPRDAAPGAHWYDVRCVVAREGGVRIALPAARMASTVRLLIDGGGVGELRYRRGESVVATAPFAAPIDLGAGARWFEYAVPAAAGAFDAVELVPRLDVPAEQRAVSVLEVCAVLGCELR